MWYLRGDGFDRSVPEDATVEEAMERLYFLAKIERGLDQSESGETTPHEIARMGASVAALPL
jgi:hypothetical protein